MLEQLRGLASLCRACQRATRSRGVSGHGSGERAPLDGTPGGGRRPVRLPAVALLQGACVPGLSLPVGRQDSAAAGATGIHIATCVCENVLVLLGGPGDMLQRMDV